MGFSSVYKSLQEVFPEVDARLLKAVAIEHPKDADQAVEVVLNEVLPYVLKHSSSSSQTANKSSTNPSDGDDHAEDAEAHDSLIRRRAPKSISREDIGDAIATSGADNAVLTPMCKNSGEHLIPDKVDKFGLDDGANVDGADNADLTPMGNNSAEHLISDEVDKFGLNDSVSVDQEISVTVTTESKTPVSMDKPQEINDEGTPTVATPILKNMIQEDLDLNSAPQLQSILTISEPADNYVAESVLPVSGSPRSVGENGPCSFNTNYVLSESETVNFDDDSVLVSRSGQICRIDLLEEIIQDAKNNKQTLFSAMESVISLMREVELHEEAAEQANVKAAKGVSDILVKVDELKNMLVRAKEANDMHAGEVYGEKAILATEVRELQSRLLNLSEERDISLAILNEMRETLESRLTSAKEVVGAASSVRLEKEEDARSQLAEQEAFMEKVVQESKILQEEAEENNKLQEFLTDRGRVVDILQGEISVICQDVRLLKERFDKRIPLSQSFTSSHTTCILASSSASLKSVASNLATDQSPTKTPRKASPTASMINGESPRSQTTLSCRESPKVARLEDQATNGSNARLDNGWDFLLDDMKVSLKLSEIASPTASMINGESPQGLHLEDGVKSDRNAGSDHGWDLLDDVRSG